MVKIHFPVFMSLGQTPMGAPIAPPATAAVPQDGFAGSAPVATVAGAPVVSAPPPPVDSSPRATVYRPQADGNYVRVSKHRLQQFAQPIKVGTDSVFVGQGPTLTRVDASGTPIFQRPLDASARFNSVDVSRDGTRLYVMNDRRLTVLDAGTGDEKGAVDLPAQSWMPRMTPLDDGRVILTGGKKMLTLGADLQPIATRDLNFEATHVTPLRDGTLVLHESMRGRHLQVIAPDGKSILEKSGETPGNYFTMYPTVTPEGKVWWLENRESSRGHAVGCFDPQTGAERSFDVFDDARKIYPRSDGSCIVHGENMVVAPRFVLYDRDGREARRFKPSAEGGLEQLVLSPDERSAYVLYDVYRGMDGQRSSAIDRFDLDAHGGAVSDGLGFIASQMGMSRSGERIYEGERDPKRFFPTVMQDGTLLVFHEKSVDRLDSNGRVVQQYPDASGLASERPRPDRDLMNGSTGADVDEHLAKWKHDYLYHDLNGHRPAGSALPTSDGCVSFEQPLAKDDAVREMALDDAQIEVAVQQGMIAKIFAGRSMETEGTVIPFPGRGGGRVVLGRETLSLETPHLGGGSDEYDRVGYSFDGEREFTTALPLRAGDRYFVVAATTDGRVYWLDGTSNSLDRDCPQYEVGAPVNRLLTMHGRVYGFAQNGNVIAIEPPPGVKLDEAGLRADAGATVSKEKDTRVIVSEREVKIGGLSIPRRT